MQGRNGDTDTENRPSDTGGKREGWTNEESVMETDTLPDVNRQPVGIPCMTQGAQTRAL